MIDVNDIPEQQLTYIKQHLTECSPQEGCGLLVNSGGGLEYWPVINSAADKMNSFRIAPQDFAEAEDAGNIVAVIHSHPGADGLAYPSILDRQLMQETCLPWFIYAPDKDDLAVFFEEPKGLLGRDFVLGATDCYGLVMAWHRSRGIQLPDFRKPYPWWEKGEELFTDENFSAAGFIKKAEAEPGDMVVFRIASSVSNHCGIYTGDGMIMHHLMNRKSTIDRMYGTYLEPRITGILRHELLPEITPWETS